MSLRAISTFSSYILKNTATNVIIPAVNLQFVRYRRTKHWDPKWKLLRKLKVIKVDMPKFNEKFEDMSEEEIRSKLKEQGLLPPRPWVEKQFFISCTGGIFEPYVPPEGDGKVSSVTAQGAKQNLQYLEKKTKSMMAIRKIRSFDEDFDTPEFCKLAQDIYVKMYECMAARDEEKIKDYITERAYPEVMHNVIDKTIRWKMIESIELPRVVHARCTDIITKENIFAQLTVRFHTKQQLAIYDRFGRLMHGSEIVAKDVLEYVVFEKHVANEYGVWRVHDKIVPDWLPPREPSKRTYKEKEETEKVVEEVAALESTEKPVETSSVAQNK